MGEDLVLLALRPNGTMHAQQKLRFALSGAELLLLAELGRLDPAGRIRVLDPHKTGDALLDAALADICKRGAGRPPQAWIASARPGLRERYLERLAGKGVVRLEEHRTLGLFRVNRWHVLDLGRVQQVRARLDAIAASTGELTPDQAAFASLVHVAGLDEALYPGGHGAQARARLRQIARKRPTSASAAAAVPTQDPASWLLSVVVLASLDAAAPASVLSGPDSFPAQHDVHHGVAHDHNTHHSHNGLGPSHHHTDHGGFDAGGGHHH